MSYKVLVMSPVYNSGLTCVSTLLAQALTYAGNTVTLAYTDQNSLLPKFLGADNIDDPTRSVMQILRLISCDALQNKDILDFTVEFSKNAHLLNLSDSSLSEKDMLRIVRHIYSRVPTDVCIVDCGEDIHSNVAQNLVELSDMIFVVITPGEKDYGRLKYWLEQTPIGKHKNVCVIINHYDETVGALRDIAKHIGLPASRVCKVHENPWIRKCCLIGKLQTILPKVKVLDARTANLSCDMDELSQCVNSTKMHAGNNNTEDLF